jgi:hypothetical protein
MSLIIFLLLTLLSCGYCQYAAQAAVMAGPYVFKTLFQPKFEELKTQYLKYAVMGAAKSAVQWLHETDKVVKADHSESLPPTS